jgi:threonine dehydrogenase-like Zn-dependent dehydrogenase
MVVIPRGFKIRSKADAIVFYQNCVVCGSDMRIYESEYYAYYLEKHVENGREIVNIYKKFWFTGNIKTIMCSSTEGAWQEKVEDIIYRYRKYINEKVIGRK